MSSNPLVDIEVAYAHVGYTVSINLQVPAMTTIMDAIKQSGILMQFPHLKVLDQTVDQPNLVGIFGEIKQLSDRVEAYDRIEIYRPIHIDPMDARNYRVKLERRKRKRKT